MAASTAGVRRGAASAVTALAWVVNDEAPREVHVAAELADLPAAGRGWAGWSLE